MSDFWPTALEFCKSDQVLKVAFDDGAAFEIPYRKLREESPSAENKGHGAGPPSPRAPIPENVNVEAADPVGRYAVRIKFSDGHTTGLYTWSLLRELGERSLDRPDSE